MNVTNFIGFLTLCILNTSTILGIAAVLDFIPFDPVQNKKALLLLNIIVYLGIGPLAFKLLCSDYILIDILWLMFLLLTLVIWAINVLICICFEDSNQYINSLFGVCIFAFLILLICLLWILDM